MAKTKISITIDTDIYNRLKKVLEGDDMSKLSLVINGTLRQSILNIEDLHNRIKSLRDKMDKKIYSGKSLK